MIVQLPFQLLFVMIGALTSVAALWLRLWWRTRYEHARRKTLVTLIRAMPAGGRLEERTFDGTTLVLTVGTVSSVAEAAAQERHQ